MLSRARLSPSCCRCSRSCRRCTGNPGTGAWGWAGRWRARSSGCSSARWSGAAWRGWSICCTPPRAPASSHCKRERERETEWEGDGETGGGEGEGERLSFWYKGGWKQQRTAMQNNWKWGHSKWNGGLFEPKVEGRRGRGFAGKSPLALRLALPYPDSVKLTWWLTFPFGRTCHALFSHISWNTAEERLRAGPPLPPPPPPPTPKTNWAALWGHARC